jgi:hypothetical protein
MWMLVNLELSASIFILIDIVIVGWFTSSRQRRGRIIEGAGQLIPW